ncbi:hypothetical protein Patl1_22178 [Pistacia atlantica]|uniref:Uncharacterized protein n=1 Tax=Pistacia atlantica TaxID=434234 RepID=A0ACC1BIL1_9ROSI|nr:hypothetical protein Patl1_22178 [Pistacia atlantica]
MVEEQEDVDGAELRDRLRLRVEDRHKVVRVTSLVDLLRILFLFLIINSHPTFIPPGSGQSPQLRRIGGAQFTLNGTHYKLVANEGRNMLHGFSDVVWKVKKYKNEGGASTIVFAYHSFDGEDDLYVIVGYTLTGDKKLKITMKATTLNKATPVNLAQQTYWNLGCHNSGNILSEEIQIFGSYFTPVDSKLIPTGKFESVKGTPYDFRKPHKVGSRISKLPIDYDINYVLDGGAGSKLRPVAIVHDKKSGRGKGGFVYPPHVALCLETQAFPDSVNHPNFPSTIVAPGKTYKHHMLFSPLHRSPSKSKSLQTTSPPTPSTGHGFTVFFPWNLQIPLLLHLENSDDCPDPWNIFSRVNSWNIHSQRIKSSPFCVTMCSVEKSKRVWIWTENRQVMTAAIERGWNTFFFLSQNHQLAKHWSTIALIDPLFVKEGEVFDSVERRVASICEVATPQELQKLQPSDEQAYNIVIDLLDWQVC